MWKRQCLFSFLADIKGKATMANKDYMVNNYYGWINYINLRCDHKKTNLSAAKKERKKEEKRL